MIVTMESPRSSSRSSPVSLFMGKRIRGVDELSPSIDDDRSVLVIRNGNYIMMKEIIIEEFCRIRDGPTIIYAEKTDEGIVRFACKGKPSK